MSLRVQVGKKKLRDKSEILTLPLRNQNWLNWVLSWIKSFEIRPPINHLMDYDVEQI